MIKTKNVFKRLLGLSLSAIVAVTSLAGTAAFASNGRLSDKSISGMVTYRAAADTGFFVNNADAVSKDGDALKIQSALDKDGNVIQDTQPVTRAFTLDKSGDVMGGLSFKIKADINNTKKQALLFAFRNPDDPTSEIKPTFFVLGWNGNLGSQTNPAWKYDPTDIVKQYENGKYYTIGIVFNKNYTYDICVDGEKIGTGVISAEDQKTKLDQMTRIDFMIAVHDETKDSKNRAAYYMKDVLWQTGGGELVAEAEKKVYSSGDEAKVKFSAPIMNPDEASKVKLYESAAGTALTTEAAAYDGENVTVKLPDNLKANAEYRIELPEFKDCFGNTLTNDNVYFNISEDAEDKRAVTDLMETFNNFTGSGITVTPEGWLRSTRGNNEGTIEKKIESDGNAVMNFGHDSTPKDARWKFVALWYDFGKTFTTGTLTMSYDIAPQIKDPGSWQSDPENWNATSFGFYALSSIPKDQGDSVKKGALLSGQLGSLLGGAKTKVSPDNEKKTETAAKWATGLELSDSNLNTWHSVKMILDLDKHIYKYYFDGALINTSTALFDDVDNASDYSKIKTDGIKGIGLFTGTYGKKSEQLIDNIRVSHTADKMLGESSEVLSEGFNDYKEEGNLFDNAEYKGYLPQSWYSTNLWGNQIAASLKPYTDSSRGTALEMGMTIPEDIASREEDDGAQWGYPELYHPLDKQYTTGVLTVDYDVNPIKLVDPNTEGLDKVTEKKWYTAGNAMTTFNMTLYKDIYTGDEVAQKKNGNKINKNNAKRIFGIQNKNFSVYKNNTMDNKGIYTSANTKAAAEGQWYKVRHIIDIDNDVIETYLGTTDEDMTLFGISKPSDFTYKENNNVTGSLKDGIGGIGFGMNDKAFLGDTCVDNISVAYAPVKSSRGISAVRFSDYNNIAYGSASKTTTLANTIAVSFTDTPDETSLNNTSITLYETANPTKTIGYMGALSKTADNVYIMSLNEFLTANTEYTLKVDGVTFGGEPMDEYTHKITAADGELIVKPMQISVKQGETVIGTVTGDTPGTVKPVSGNTIEALVVIINTTGDEHEYAFSAGVYKNKLLDKFDFRTIKLDGRSADGKYAKAVCTFTLDDEAVKDLTKVRAYLWNGMTTMQPLGKSCDLLCGTAE